MFKSRKTKRIGGEIPKIVICYILVVLFFNIYVRIIFISVFFTYALITALNSFQTQRVRNEMGFIYGSTLILGEERDKVSDKIGTLVAIPLLRQTILRNNKEFLKNLTKKSFDID